MLKKLQKKQKNSSIMPNLPLKGSTNNGMIVSPQPGNAMGGLAGTVKTEKGKFTGVLGNPKGLDLVSMAKDLAKTNHVNKMEKAKKLKKSQVK